MLENKTFNVVEKFKIFICIALAFILIGGVFMIVNAASGKNVMNFGIDFTGGAVIDIDLGSFATKDENKTIIDNEIKKLITETHKYKIAGGEMQYSPLSDGGATYTYRLEYYKDGAAITTKEGGEAFLKDVKDVLRVEIKDTLIELFDTDPTLVAAGAYLADESGEGTAVNAYGVSATASSSLIGKAIIALIVAIAVMLVYIIIRFTASSALAAVCALVHDVLIMIALTTVFNIAVNSTFVAAVITIVGYSINATIIIFDRIREELKTSSAKDKTDTEIANLAIKDTLNRTILTTITTLVMVVVLAIFSVSTISEFIVPIIFGLLAGAFSSILLAPSIWVAFRKIAKSMKEKKESKNAYGGKKANEQ